MLYCHKDDRGAPYKSSRRVKACVGVAAVKGAGAEESSLRESPSGIAENIRSAVVAGGEKAPLARSAIYYFIYCVKSGSRSYGYFVFTRQKFCSREHFVFPALIFVYKN